MPARPSQHLARRTAVLVLTLTLAACGSDNPVAPDLYSPDGKRIAFCISISGNWDIFVRNLTDGTIKRLTTNVGMDIHPAWSSDGTRIAFSSNRTGKSQIWTVPSNVGTQVRITNTSWRKLRRHGRTD